MPFKGSHAWKVRQKYGHGLLLLPVASVIVEREDRAILLMKRKSSGLWGTIGGYAEEGDSFRSTAITELREEAAIQANEADLIPFATLSDPKKMRVEYPNGDKVQGFAQLFIIRKWQQLDEPVDAEEVEELQFFQLDEIDPAILHPSIEAGLNAYKAFLRTGEFQSR